MRLSAGIEDSEGLISDLDETSAFEGTGGEATAVRLSTVDGDAGAARNASQSQASVPAILSRGRIGDAQSGGQGGAATESTVVDGFYQRLCGFRTCDSHADDRRRLHTRVCPNIEVDTSPGGYRVLDRVATEGCSSEAIVLDNGPEFRSRALAAWSAERDVRLESIQPGKPMQNAYVQRFNGRLRDECLNANWVWQLKRCAAKDRNLAARLHPTASA
jgi:transposase InsO family protein